MYVLKKQWRFHLYLNKDRVNLQSTLLLSQAMHVGWQWCPSSTRNDMPSHHVRGAGLAFRYRRGCKWRLGHRASMLVVAAYQKFRADDDRWRRPLEQVL
jgi:hypothetical protein